MNCDCVHAGIQEFSSGGGGGVQVQIYFFSFLVLNLFYRSPRKLQFSKVAERVQQDSWWSQLFLGVGGSICLFPIVSHIICEFPGGSGPQAPPPPN